MGAFEHVLSLISFIYALALAHLLTTVARLIANRGRVRISWLHAYWMVNATTVLVVDWISYWDLRTVTAWSMADILICVVSSFADYMQAALVCPEIPVEGEIDLPSFHARQSSIYIGAFAFTGFVALVMNYYYSTNFDVREYATQNIAVLPLLAIAITAALVRRRWVQVTAPFLLSGIWIYYFINLQSALK